MTADELARMRKDILFAKAKCAWHVNVPPDTISNLIDELEKTQGERDAVRALLAELSPWLSLLPESPLRARICRELDDAP